MPSTFANRPDTTDWSYTTYKKDRANDGDYSKWFFALPDTDCWEEEGNQIEANKKQHAELVEVLAANNNKTITIVRPEASMTGELIASTQIAQNYVVYATDDSLGFWLWEARIQRDDNEQLTIIVD